MNVWFDDSKKEVICEEIDDETVIRKDKLGRIIGFEKLNFFSALICKRRPPVEVIVS